MLHRETSRARCADVSGVPVQRERSCDDFLPQLEKQLVSLESISCLARCCLLANSVLLTSVEHRASMGAQVDEPEEDKPAKTLDADDIRFLKMYGLGPYAAAINDTGKDIKDIQKRVVETIGIKESDTGLAPPSRWDIVADKQMLYEEQPLQVRDHVDQSRCKMAARRWQLDHSCLWPIIHFEMPICWHRFLCMPQPLEYGAESPSPAQRSSDDSHRHSETSTSGPTYVPFEV
jgi:hypothetical protein